MVSLTKRRGPVWASVVSAFLVLEKRLVTEESLKGFFLGPFGFTSELNRRRHSVGEQTVKFHLRISLRSSAPAPEIEVKHLRQVARLPARQSVHPEPARLIHFIGVDTESGL